MAVGGFSRKGPFFIFTFLFVVTCSQTLSPPYTLQTVKANYEEAVKRLEAAKANYESTMAAFHTGMKMFEPEIRVHEFMIGGFSHPDVDLDGIKANLDSLLAAGRMREEQAEMIKEIENELECQRRAIAFLEGSPSAM